MWVPRFSGFGSHRACRLAAMERTSPLVESASGETRLRLECWGVKEGYEGVGGGVVFWGRWGVRGWGVE